MKSIRIRFLVAALAVMLGSAIANAQTADAPPAPPTHKHGFGPEGHMIGFFGKYLDLTDAQRAQMKAVMQKERATMHPLMQQERQLDTQLKQYSEGAYDETKVQALVTQQAQTLVQIKVEQTRIHNELYQLFTPDQQAKMKEMEAKRAARMQAHMHSAPASETPSNEQ